MRHLKRCHDVDPAWLHDEHSKEGFRLEKVDTHDQAADIFTKAFTIMEKWIPVRSLIAHYTDKEIKQEIEDGVIMDPQAMQAIEMGIGEEEPAPEGGEAPAADPNSAVSPADQKRAEI